MMKTPQEITLAKLEVVVMPNGEIICMGKTIGMIKNLGKYLTIAENNVIDRVYKQEESGKF